MKKIITSFLLAITLLIGDLGAAFAVVPHLPDLVSFGNKWRIQYYNDASPVHDRLIQETFCFEPDSVVGTHQRYRWYLESNPAVRGIASQEGDQITMVGDHFLQNNPEIIISRNYQWELSTVEIINPEQEFGRGSGMGHSQVYFRKGDDARAVFMNIYARRFGKCEQFEPPIIDPPVVIDPVEETETVLEIRRLSRERFNIGEEDETEDDEPDFPEFDIPRDEDLAV